MREECKHFQSRTYESGEVARFCILDLAPEAPWRCPENCPKFEPRLADAGWVHGSLVEPPIEEEPDMPSDEVADVLGRAESIVTEVAPEALAEARARDAAEAREAMKEQVKREGRSGRRWWRRRR